MATMLLGSLPESYETLVTALESRPENEITLSIVKGKLIDEYKRREGVKATREDIQETEAAMKTEFKNKGTAHAKKTCYFCKKSEHFKSECMKYKSWKSKREKSNKATENASSSDYCFYATSSKAEETCCGAKSREVRNSWIVDSSATSHMVTSRDFFECFHSKGKVHVRLADEKKIAEIQGTGSGGINCATGSSIVEMEINNVLYVSTLGSNLLSVKKLVKEGYN